MEPEDGRHKQQWNVRMLQSAFLCPVATLFIPSSCLFQNCHVYSVLIHPNLKVSLAGYWNVVL
jgi:hypothetical protein